MNRRSILLSLGLATLAATLAACPSFDYDAGRWACDVDADCPGGQRCNVDAGVCTTDDGGGGDGGSGGSDERCLANCRSLSSTCGAPVPDSYCVAACSGAVGSECRKCVDEATSCPAAQDCLPLCQSGGPTGCDATCARFESDCSVGEHVKCTTCCGAGGFSCDSFLNEATCPQVMECGNACNGIGG